MFIEIQRTMLSRWQLKKSQSLFPVRKDIIAVPLNNTEPVKGSVFHVPTSRACSSAN